MCQKTEFSVSRCICAVKISLCGIVAIVMTECYNSNHKSACPVPLSKPFTTHHSRPTPCTTSCNLGAHRRRIVVRGMRWASL